MGFVSTLFKAGLLKKGVEAAKKYLEHKNKSEGHKRPRVNREK